MSRRVLTLLLVLFLIPAVSAGSEADPELTDAAGDAAQDIACTPPGCLNDVYSPNSAAPGMVDVLAAWVEQNATHYNVTVQTAAAPDATTQFTVSFNLEATNDSLYPGAATGQLVTAVAMGDTVSSGPANTTVAQDGAFTKFTFTLADTDATGGDRLTNLTVATTRSESKSGTLAAGTQTDSDTTDGASRPYNFSRPAKMGNLSMIVTGGSLTQAINGTNMTTSFSGGNATLNETVNGTASLTFTLTVRNDGLDPDTLFLLVFDAGGLASRNITAVVNPMMANATPGQTIPVALMVDLNNTASGNHTIHVQATSSLGGFASSPIIISVPAAPLPPEPPVEPPAEPEPEDEERKLAVAGLGFLTPVAEALGLIEPFGEYAELVLLAVIVLLVILVLFLIIFLATRGSIKIRIEPRKMVVAPGQTAEFRVAIKNRKGAETDALASFEGDPEWETSLSFGGHEMTAAGADAAMHLGGKKDETGVRHGILKVTAPEAAHEKESDRVTIAVAPLREDGSRRKAQRTQIRVQTEAEAAVTGGVRLAGVEHDPSHPEAGQVVETTARVENDSEDETKRLRVVLNVDGEDLQEQPVMLPPQQARAVVFTWQVPAGSSKVRVRIYSDE